jgi:hypothetical protein
MILVIIIAVTAWIEPGMVMFASLVSLPYLLVLFLVRDEYLHSVQQSLEQYFKLRRAK